MARKPSTQFLPGIKPGQGPSLAFEKKYREMGYAAVAGVDEAGRGPLAGPVVAAAVILPERIEAKSPLYQARDSKVLTPGKREALYEVIAEQALSCSWAGCDAEEIDGTNILAASLEAMRRAVMGLKPIPDLCLVDGRESIPGRLISVPLIKGDHYCLSIAAASIMAKVIRDRIMAELDKKYPAYGFALHKGYATAGHRAAIKTHGPCPVHRKSFHGVKEWI